MLRCRHIYQIHAGISLPTFWYMYINYIKLWVHDIIHAGKYLGHALQRDLATFWPYTERNEIPGFFLWM